MKLFLAQKKSVNYVLEAKSSLENDTITIPIETNYYLLKINFYVFFFFIYLDVMVVDCKVSILIRVGLEFFIIFLIKIFFLFLFFNVELFND